ncbi:MAG: hypothetical protein K6B68_09030 [Eubacterium sp.]|nr:hypothetical protein [Eubacterium sp.]
MNNGDALKALQEYYDIKNQSAASNHNGIKGLRERSGRKASFSDRMMAAFAVIF